MVYAPKNAMPKISCVTHRTKHVQRKSLVESFPAHSQSYPIKLLTAAKNNRRIHKEFPRRSSSTHSRRYNGLCFVLFSFGFGRIKGFAARRLCATYALAALYLGLTCLVWHELLVAFRPTGGAEGILPFPRTAAAPQWRKQTRPYIRKHIYLGKKKSNERTE